MELDEYSKGYEKGFKDGYDAGFEEAQNAELCIDAKSYVTIESQQQAKQEKKND